MNDETRQKLEEIIEQMECPKNFLCAKNGFEHLCKARDFGVRGFLYCLEDTPQQCPFAIPFGFIHICRCPLRVFVEKNLRKQAPGHSVK
ncbi:MAG TPA: hypothetical protein VF799_07495 [Geobacteraceae bacterium]